MQSEFMRQHQVGALELHEQIAISYIKWPKNQSENISRIQKLGRGLGMMLECCIVNQTRQLR